MAKLGVSKESLEQKRMTGGVYEVQFVKFSPKKSSKSTPENPSILLRPEMKIVGNADFNGRQVFDKYGLGLNSAWSVQDFVHMFGLELDPDGNIPGEWDFKNQPDNPEVWQYRGPLVGRTGRLELIEEEYTKRDGTKAMGLRPKQYICAVANCVQKNPNIRHSTSIS